MVAFRVVAYPHLGLGLTIGRVYTETMLRFRCHNDEAKLTSLKEFLENPQFFQRVHVRINFKNGTNQKDGNKTKQKKKGLRTSLHSRSVLDLNDFKP